MAPPSGSQINSDIIKTILLLKVNLNDICLLFHSKHITPVTGKESSFLRNDSESDIGSSDIRIHINRICIFDFE